jgi:hypothetical protein
MKKIIWTFVFLVFVGCQPSEKNQLEMQTYPVSKAQAEVLYSSLKRLLESGKEGLGRVQLIDNSQLVVVAPAAIQKDIKKLIDQVETRQGEGRLAMVSATIGLYEMSEEELSGRKLAPADLVADLKSSDPTVPPFIYEVDQISVKSNEGAQVLANSSIMKGEAKFVRLEKEIMAEMKLRSSDFGINVEGQFMLNPAERLIMWKGKGREFKPHLGPNKQADRSFVVVFEADIIR